MNLGLGCFVLTQEGAGHEVTVFGFEVLLRLLSAISPARPGLLFKLFDEFLLD